MATTYSTNASIKKIGTGLEQGTWGGSTSQNFERVSDMIGRTVSLNVLSMPTGSTNAPADGTTSAIWVLLDPSNSGDSPDVGSEGRCRAVEFFGAADNTNPINMEIRGATTATNVSRTLFVWNNLDASTDMTLDGADGTEYTLKNGAFAIVTVIASATGGWVSGAAGVQNLLSKAQFEDIILAASTGSLEF